MFFHCYRFFLYSFISLFLFSTFSLSLSSLSPQNQLNQTQYLLAQQEEVLSFGWFKGSDSEGLESVDDLEPEFLYTEKTPLLSPFKAGGYGTVDFSSTEEVLEQTPFFQPLVKTLLQKIISVFNFIEDGETGNSRDFNQIDEEQYDDDSIKRLMQTILTKMAFFLECEVFAPVNALPNIYLSMIRMTLSTLTTFLYSWKLGVTLFSSHIALFLLQKLFSTRCSSRMMSNLIHWFLIGVQIISRPQLFFTSLAGCLFLSFCIYFMYKLLKRCGVNRRFLPYRERRIAFCSFCFAVSNLTLDILVPELYINKPSVPQSSSEPEVCNGIRGLCDKRILDIKGAAASHNFASNWKVFAMQEGTAYDQLQAGVRIFHTKYNSTMTTKNCAVFSTLGDLQGFPLLGNLSSHLNDMARFLRETENELVLLVLDDLHLKYPDPCLIQTLQGSELSSMMFPYSLQIGESFNPTVREILDTGSKVVVFYFNFVDNLQYRLAHYPDSNTTSYYNLTIPLIRFWNVPGSSGLSESQLEWSFLGSTSAHMGVDSSSGYSYAIDVDWKLLEWAKWQISDLLTTQVSNIITAKGNQSLVISTNYGAEALTALPAALYNTHLQEYFEYLVERNSTPSVILMGYFQFSNFYVFQNCVNTIKDLTLFRLECNLPSEQTERLLLILSTFGSRTLLYPVNRGFCNDCAFVFPCRCHQPRCLKKVFTPVPFVPLIEDKNTSFSSVRVDNPVDRNYQSSSDQRSKVQSFAVQAFQFITETIPRPIDHAPNTYIELIRMMHNLFSTVLFSYKLASGILLFHVSLNIAQRYMPTSVNHILRMVFLMIRAATRPVQFSISLAGSWFVMLPFYGINRFSLQIRKKELISPHHIDMIGSFVFGGTQLVIELFFPQLYLQSDNFSQTYHMDFEKTLNSNKTLLDAFIFGGHDSAHYTPYISVQHMNFDQQLKFGTNFFHFELLNRPTSSESCNIWVVHGGKSLNWPLLPLEKGLDHLNDALEHHPESVVSLILDDVAGSYPTSCLIQTLKQSEIYSKFFPQTLQISPYFNPTLYELKETGYQVLLYYQSPSSHMSNYLAEVNSTTFVGNNNLSVPLLRQWAVSGESYGNTTDFLGSTYNAISDLAFLILDWNAFQFDQLFTTHVISQYIHNLPDSVFLYVMTHFGTLSWTASCSELYNRQLFHGFDYLIGHNIIPKIIVVNHMEFSNVRHLVTCLNSIENPANYRRLCSLPNENVQFALAIVDRFLAYLPIYHKRRFVNALCMHYCFKLCRKKRSKKSISSFPGAYLKQGEKIDQWRKKRRGYPLDRSGELDFLEQHINSCQPDNVLSKSLSLYSRKEPQPLSQNVAINANFSVESESSAVHSLSLPHFFYLTDPQEKPDSFSQNIVINASFFVKNDTCFVYSPSRSCFLKSSLSLQSA